MAGAFVYQTAFNRGELDTALAGRSDWQSYFGGAQKLRNMICRPQGGAYKRAGTEMVAETLDPDKPSIFIRFQFAVTQVYMLEFSEYRFRVLMDGGVVKYPAGHSLAGQEVVIESPYSAEQMQRVRVAQTEDVMIFTHPDHQPRSLTRKDHHIWVFEALLFGAGINPPDGLRFTKDGLNQVQYVVSAVKSNNDESLPGDVLTAGKATGVTMPLPVGGFQSLTITQLHSYAVQWAIPWPAQWDIWNMTTTQIRSQYLLQLGFTGGYIHNKTIWNIKDPSDFWWKSDKDDYSFWMYTVAIPSTDKGWGGVLATMRTGIANTVAANNAIAQASGHSTLEWNPVADAVRYKVYRSFTTDNGTFFYLIGTTTQTTFDDDNLGYVDTTTPQTSKEPFTGPGNYPGVCAFYDQRLILARTNNQPNTVWGSRTGAWRNFNTNVVDEDGENQSGSISDTSAWEFTLYADEVNEILWCKSMNDLLFGTAGGEFRMGGGGYTITPTNVNATRQSNYGCSSINPVLVGQSVIGAGSGNRSLLAYQWEYSGDAYRGTSISHMAGHLFEGRRMAGFDCQADVDSIIWVVMSDGALLSLTFMSEEKVLSWSRHDTDGRFEAVAAMKDLAGNNEMWFIVAREINGVTRRFIERLKTVQTAKDDIADAWYVDCGLTRYGDPQNEFSGLDHLEGKTVVCLGDGNVFENLVVRSGTVTLPKAVRRATIGLPYTAELETMEMEPMNGLPIAQMAKEKVLASVLFYHSRECHYGHEGALTRLELGFRTEPHPRPIQPKTIRKNFLLPKPLGDNRATLRLACAAPVPFGVLSAALELNIESAHPHPGRAIGVV